MASALPDSLNPVTRIGENPLGMQVQQQSLRNTLLASLLGSQAALPGSNNAVSTQLSAGAQLIQQALQQSDQPAMVRPANSLLNLSATAALPDSRLIAQALQHALSQSGLFYEAHLHQTLQGKRSSDSLLQEPQNQPSRQPAEAASLLSQQLQVLEQRRVHWQGEVWPGQPMHWETEVEEHGQARRTQEDGRSSHTDIEAAPAVTSRLQLQLPALGNVSAVISLREQGLHIRLQADEAETGVLLQTRLTNLVNALQQLPAARLDSLQVQTGKPAAATAASAHSPVAVAPRA